MKLKVSNEQITSKYTKSWRSNNTLLNDELVKEEIKKRNKKFLELSENKSTTQQNLWDKLKAVIRGKFIA